jgi:integrase/recombinase XerD
MRQFENLLDGKVCFLDEITRQTLCDFRDFLTTEGYEPRTLHNRLLLVLVLLKANGLKTEFSLVRDLPEYFARGLYHIRTKPVGFTPKKRESRDVEALKGRKKIRSASALDFHQRGGKPEGHFLEKLKRIALRAKVNCGHCKSPWTAGRYPTKKIEVTCATHPVCQHHYLYRLRKTCASNWEAKGVPVRTIQYMLGHNSPAHFRSKHPSRARFHLRTCGQKRRPR